MSTIQKLVISLVLILGVSILSYAYFLRYQPKTLRQSDFVKGAETSADQNIPYPVDAQKIGTSQTVAAVQTTFETMKSPDEVQRFYKNIFSEDGWNLDSQKTDNNFLVSKYKKDKKVATIVSSRQEDNTITVASVELTK